MRLFCPVAKACASNSPGPFIWWLYWVSRNLNIYFCHVLMCLCLANLTLKVDLGLSCRSTIHCAHD